MNNSTHRYYRLAEIIIPTMVWLTITMPLWLSPFRPALVAYIILGYLLYFLYKTIKTVYYATISYRLLKRAEKVDWLEWAKESEMFSKIQHFIIIPTYKETEEKLSKTIDCILNQNYPKQKIHIVLAMEEREGDSVKQKSQNLIKKYKNEFGSFTASFHVLKENEVIGKASNATYALKNVSAFTKRHNMEPENTIITVCDADCLLASNYLPYVTYKFLNDSDRKYRFFWAPVLLYNNFWKLPLPVRMQTIMSSVARFAYLSQRDELIQISTYSTNLWLLEEVNYWDVDIIPEDWHIYLQAFFKFGEKVKTIPIYLPMMRDGVLAHGLWKTLAMRYSQEKRWAWGATDIPYAIMRFFNTPHINPLVKLKKILFIIEVHFLWPTSFFILTISASIPPLINPSFKRTVLGFLLPKLSSFILTVASVSLIMMVYFDYKLRERMNIKTPLRNIPLLFIQWYLLPVISFFFSSLPALESHTRMLLGKKIEYKVTEKL